jgi:isoleucyl-tRNA synthetase
MNVPRFAGFDTHGLPIEYEIEKELGIKTTQQVEEFGIGNYNEACRGIVLRYADVWEEQMGRLGRWIDFKNQYKTMDLSFMNSVWWVFKNLYDKGRIYEGVKIMGYSTTCGTPLSNFEIQQNYQEVQDDSLFIKIPLKINSQSDNFASKFTGANILVWTTTPWTLPSNYALCVGKDIDYVLVELDDVKYVCGEKLIENIFKTWKSEFNFSKVHNVGKDQLNVLLTARLIMITIAYHDVYIPACRIIAKQFSV